MRFIPANWEMRLAIVLGLASLAIASSLPAQARFELPRDTALSRDGAVRVAPLFMHRLADSAAAARAVIPVERIRGAVLLISSTDDGQWPSTPMAERIMARLRANRFAYPYTHIANEGADHSMARPYITIVTPEGPNAVTGRRSDNG